jgi:hypothetical protein
MLIIIALDYFKIYRFGSYLLHAFKSEVEVIKLAYSVSNVGKTNYFLKFIVYTAMKMHAFKRTTRVMVYVYLFRFKKIKDVYLLNFLNNYDNARKFINKFFK